MTGTTSEVRAAIIAAYRDDWGQVLATLIGVTRDWDLAEDCAQEAFTAAVTDWTRNGIPERPGAWLTTTARNRARDRLRRDAVGARKLADAHLIRPNDDDTMTNARLTMVRRLAKRRGQDRYNEPCASG